MFSYICAMFKKLYRRYLLWEYQRLFERLYLLRMQTNPNNAYEFAQIDFEWIAGVEWMVCLNRMRDDWVSLFGIPPYLSSSDKQEEQGES